MSYTVLARKHRPRRFEEIVGQEHVARSLQNAVKTGKVGHAYLLTGTRGIGKTTAARIFAKALTCENLTDSGNPCLECSQCLSMDAGNSIDVSEMDGASNNGVESVRQLVENIQYLPTKGKFKVYIIDEVHMLSTQAFNALLKTLEEPPPHVIFILATTDPQKLLHTVLSRCQRFDFRNASTAILTKHLKDVLQKEEVTFEQDEMISKIAKLAKGSFRDALSLVDQVLSFSMENHIKEESFTYALGIAKTSSIREISNALLIGNLEGVVKSYRECIKENVDLKNLINGILDYLFFVIENIDNANSLYQHNVVDQGALDDIGSSELFWIYENLIKDFEWGVNSLDPEKVCEIILRKTTLRREVFSAEPVKKKTESAIESLAAIQEAPAKLEETPAVEEEKVENSALLEEPVKLELNVDATWQKFLNFLSGSNQVLRANLEQGNLLESISRFEDKVVVTLAFDEAAQVFADYLEETVVYDKVKSLLGEFFKVDEDQITLEIRSLNKKEKEQTNFKSISEQQDEHEAIQMAEKEKKIQENQFVKQAEEVFGSQVDKVLLNSDNK